LISKELNELKNKTLKECPNPYTKNPKVITKRGVHTNTHVAPVFTPRLHQFQNCNLVKEKIVALGNRLW